MFHIPKGFKAFQSSRNCFKYSEKEIGFSRGNLATFTCFQTFPPKKRGFLHKTGFSLPHRYDFDGRSESKEPQFRLLET